MLNVTFEQIELDPSVRASINYAKARETINTELKTRRERRAAKMVVIQYLEGELVSTDSAKPQYDDFGNLLKRVSVHFKDGSKAVF
ncbi:hypothetical protein vBAfQDWS535_50 [Alcaligenes phage vB_Af_QDWS535]|nr:hypothetical protein vBAfQDWS535_50 [Alcaligenes phage vB_Af_QDWS535]